MGVEERRRAAWNKWTRRGIDPESAARIAACLYPIDDEMEVSREFRKAARTISRQFAALLAQVTSIAEAKEATGRAYWDYRKLSLSKREHYSELNRLSIFVMPLWDWKHEA